MSNIEEYINFLAKPMKDKDASDARNSAAKDLKTTHPGIYILVLDKIEEYKKEYSEDKYFYLDI